MFARRTTSDVKREPFRIRPSGRRVVGVYICGCERGRERSVSSRYWIRFTTVVPNLVWCGRPCQERDSLRRLVIGFESFGILDSSTISGTCRLFLSYHPETGSEHCGADYCRKLFTSAVFWIDDFVDLSVLLSLCLSVYLSV